MVEEAGTLILRTYRWGNSLCPTRDLNDRNVDNLLRAVGNRGVEIKPFYRTGNATSRCLVAFLIAEPDVIDGIGQFP